MPEALTDFWSVEATGRQFGAFREWGTTFSTVSSHTWKEKTGFVSLFDGATDWCSLGDNWLQASSLPLQTIWNDIRVNITLPHNMLLRYYPLCGRANSPSENVLATTSSCARQNWLNMWTLLDFENGHWKRNSPRLAQTGLNSSCQIWTSLCRVTVNYFWYNWEQVDEDCLIHFPAQMFTVSQLPQFLELLRVFKLRCEYPWVASATGSQMHFTASLWI